MMGTASAVTIQRASNGITTVSLRAEGRMPVISLASGTALAEAFEALASDGDTRVVVLQGDKGHFCAGGDIVAMREALDDPDRLLGAIMDQFHRCVRAMHALPQPVVASVAGAAAGGGLSLALACDLIVCAADARFIVGYPALGTSSDGGLSHTLARRVGSMRALDIILTRSALTADEALALGLVARVTEPAALSDATMAYAERLAQHPTQALREFKQLLLRVEDQTLAAQLDAEKAAFLRCARTQDFRDRVIAFLDKRR